MIHHRSSGPARAHQTAAIAGKDTNTTFRRNPHLNGKQFQGATTP
jgi:hypothetical protein